ncbi:DNA-binding protein [Piscirickettsia litoralis]|uniref:DNA-binding protein n=1 Tax=Piscirickettsia litoralis TaxID=1891921 RepID=A0ABX3A6F0_9GAMM|nr:DNA-binding protein [Piscirickettsia litoralis]ODN43807.1 DNA-binding protein [Piscirickettsia litoralis]
MPRPGLTYDEITEAANRVLAAGEKPTINRVREALGGRGSSTTISRYLKDWKRQVQEGQLAEPQKVETEESTAKKEVAVPAASVEEQASVVAPVEAAAVESAISIDEELQLCFSEEEYELPAVTNEQFRPVETDSELEALRREHEALKIQFRRLNSAVNKERIRRQAFEMLAREAKEYVNVIKEQVGQRILDLRMASDQTINQLKAHAREAKQESERELKFYREELMRIQKETGRSGSHSKNSMATGRGPRRQMTTSS